MDLVNKILSASLAVILGFYILVYAFVPQIAGFTTAISSINSQNWSWAVYLAFLVLIFVLIMGVANYLKGKK